MSKVDLLTVTASSLKKYGEEVVFNRQIPQVFDGLKPVQRYLLWSLHGLGLRHTSAFKKAARTVGETIGKYHPHGDASCYDAMVRITGTRNDQDTKWATKHINIPLIEGFGNWGDIIEREAAQRYTEARLSRFSCDILLDPVYLAATEFQPNYSRDELEPVVLPAKLPMVLLNGTHSIAFGLAASSPSFELKGVVALVIDLLSGQPLTTKLCLQHLKYASTYGGECLSGKAELAEIIKTGQGSLTFRPTIEEHAKTITIVSGCPSLASKGSWETAIAALSNLDPAITSVLEVSDDVFRVEIHYKPSADSKALLAQVQKCLTRKARFNIGAFEKRDGKYVLHQSSILKILELWLAWRIQLEQTVILHLKGIEEAKRNKLRLGLLAASKLDLVVAALKATKKDPVKMLMASLKITEEEANFILDMRVRQLRALDIPTVKAAIDKCDAEIRELDRDRKDPRKRIIKQLQSLDLSRY